MNLNTVLLINPKNEEAIFNLMKLQIKKSNFSELNKNFEIFKKVCKNLCFRSSEISKELKKISKSKCFPQIKNFKNLKKK